MSYICTNWSDAQRKMLHTRKTGLRFRALCQIWPTQTKHNRKRNTQNKTQHSLNMNYLLILLYLFLIKIPLTNVELPPLCRQWLLFCQWVKSSMVLSIRLYSRMSQSHVYDKSSYMSTLISCEDVWYRLCVQLSVITNSFIAQIYSNGLTRRKNMVMYVIIRRSCVTLCPLLW